MQITNTVDEINRLHRKVVGSINAGPMRAHTRCWLPGVFAEAIYAERFTGDDSDGPRPIGHRATLLLTLRTIIGSGGHQKS
jgi:hypothetical protein